MEMLGLGVRLNFEDNMTSEINPLVRDLERLRREATKTTQTFDNMGKAYNPFNAQRRRDVEDYRASVQNTDQALLNISDRLIRASKSAISLSTAVNRMQFTGRFNQMYSDITRVQRMLGNMGYGMTKMQKDMANNRAYNMLNYQMRDLHDRIKFTTQAIKEMQDSPDSSRFRQQIDLAQRSLRAYQNQLASMGSLEKRLATTHGMGIANYGGRPVLYENASTEQEALKNRLLGATMMDLAVASNFAYNSLDKTGKMMVGFGYTTMEARQKLNTYLTTLQTVGMGLSQFLTVPLGMATVAIGVLINRWEEASNVFHARTLIDPNMWSKTEDALRDMAVNTGATQMETSASMSASYNIFGDTKGLDYSLEQAERSLFMFKVHGVSAEKSLRDVNQIMSKFGVSSNQAWDMYVAGAIEAKKETGKGFTGTNGVDRISDYVTENAQALKNATGELGAYSNAYERMTNAYEKGIMENLIESFGTLGSIIIAVIKPTTPVLEKFFGTIKSGLEGILGFFRANEALSRFIAFTGMLAVAFGILIGPIAVATALLVRYRNIIQGVTQSVVALNRGGLAVLSPQARMASNAVKAFTVAIARFPQTLLAGAIPALYTFIRQLPLIGFNILRLNPIMSGLTIGMIAYSQNWLGFGDTVDKVINRVKNSVSASKTIIDNALGGKEYDLSRFSNMTQIFAKMQGTALMARKVITGIFGGTKLEFSAGEMNLMEQLGIEGFVNSIAKTGKQVRDFWVGFKDGVTTTFEAMKTFYGWMRDTFSPVFDYIGDKILGVMNGLSIMLGGDGYSKFDDIRLSAWKLNEDMFNLGKLAGTVLTAFLGFKLLKPVFSIFKNPFAGFITSAKRATDAVKTMNRAVRGVGTGGIGQIFMRGRNTPVVTNTPVGGTVSGVGAGVPVRGARNTVIPVAPTRASTTIAGGGMNTGTLSNRQLRRLDPQQRATYERTLVNNAVARRGNDRNRGEAVHGRAGQNYGSTMYARRQGVVRRALFGQSFDTYDNDGRRVERERRGGLLRRRAEVTNMSNVSLRDRMIDTRQNVSQRVSSAGTAIRNTGNALGQAVRNSAPVQGARNAGARVGGAVMNSKPMKAIRVPVQYVMGRLNTAGVVRQGTQGGRQSGNMFKRAFNTATRGLGAGARMFSGAVRGAGTAGARAGNGMLKGMGFVSKGIGGIFKAGFKLIPILGWALMAWDIVSTIFTNWDSIKAGAGKAWNWIKENGVTALSSAFTAIVAFGATAWNWLKTDGIAMAISLGGQFIQWIAHDAFPKIVSFAGSVLTGFITTAGSIASSIGSAMWSGITSALSGLGDWLGKQIAKVPGGSFVVEKLTGKKYARGGIINAPHMGIVGEAGPEAIIPLSGNQRNRAQMLLARTAGMLGMDISDKDDNQPQFIEPNEKPVKVAQPIVRGSNGANKQNSGGKTEDNSVTINTLQLNLPQGANVDEQTGKALAKKLAKELQKIMKQERLRSSGKNLTLEDVILNM